MANKLKKTILGGLTVLAFSSGCNTTLFNPPIDWSPWEHPRTPFYFLNEENLYPDKPSDSMENESDYKKNIRLFDYL